MSLWRLLSLEEAGELMLPDVLRENLRIVFGGASGGTNMVNYDFGVSLPGWEFVSDYAKAFSLNFGYVTFNRSEMAGRMHEWYQTLLINIEVLKIVVLVSFFVLALRRKFKRKSF